MTDTANAFRVIVMGLIQISLSYQVYVIFKCQRWNIWGILTTCFSSLFSLITVGFFINSAVLAHKKNAAFAEGTEMDFVSLWNELPIWLFSANINIMSVLLILKLGMAIRTRRYLGLKQFDGLHILVIMSTQTLIVPSILLIVHYFGVSNAGTILVQVSIMLIVLTLPLTSLWAQTQNNTENINSSPSMSFIRREASNDTMVTSQYGSTKMGLDSEKTSPSTVDDSTLYFDKLDKRNTAEARVSALPPDIEQLIGEEESPGVTPGVAYL
ncbi:Pheromone alpha factor receptor [Spathaspora sp. JA1]|nr:Pheromone alpha factor receptor [Spathaspora sp. JA1]